MLIVYIVFLLFCIFISNSKLEQKQVVLFLSCVILSFGIGFRRMAWPDTDAYMYFFKEFTPSLSDFSFTSKPFGYSEKGFYFLGVLAKTFTNNYQIYFLFIGAVSMFFLYKNLRKYSLFPLIGLCAYLARFFMNRNLVQIRAGLAYLIIIWGIKYIHEKKMWHYILLVWIASLFHHSAWIALPLYFICNWVNINKKIILWGLGLAFIIGGFFQGPVSSFITDNASDLNVVTYTQGIYVTEAKGLANPMIYFQVFLLLSYTFLEKKLAPLDNYYYVIRDGYFYSTLILICFCSFTALSGRTSSIFATLEFAIIPSLVYLFEKKERVAALFLMGVALVGIMYMYMPPNIRWSL